MMRVNLVVLTLVISACNTSVLPYYDTVTQCVEDGSPAWSKLDSAGSRNLLGASWGDVAGVWAVGGNIPRTGLGQLDGGDVLQVEVLEIKTIAQIEAAAVSAKEQGTFNHLDCPEANRGTDAVGANASYRLTLGDYSFVCSALHVGFAHGVPGSFVNVVSTDPGLEIPSSPCMPDKATQRLLTTAVHDALTEAIAGDDSLPNDVQIASLRIGGLSPISVPGSLPLTLQLEFAAQITSGVGADQSTSYYQPGLSFGTFGPDLVLQDEN